MSEGKTLHSAQNIARIAKETKRNHSTDSIHAKYLMPVDSMYRFRQLQDPSEIKQKI
jgi:hypothetical protein